MNNDMLICSTVILGGVCMTCCFIGHRKIKHKKELASRLRDNICYLLEQGVATFLFGDHSEFNTLCYDTVTELMQEYSQIKRVKFRKDYPEITESVKQYFFNGYEDNICPKGVAQSGRASYVERNQAMIIASDICIFYYNKDYQPKRRKESKHSIGTYQPKSGTRIAYEFAISKKKEIVNLYE